MDNQPNTSDYNFLGQMVFSPESEQEFSFANGSELSPQHVVSNDSERIVRENFTTLMPTREGDSDPM